MRRSVTDLAGVISRALITGSNQLGSSQLWTPGLERILHGLGCRESLSPSLVAQVIDPFLLYHHSLAFGFFNWAAQQPGFVQTPATFESVLRSLSISRQFNSMDKVLKQVRVQKVPLRATVYGSIIDSYVSGKKSHLAFAVFCQFVSEIALMGPEICNSLLACLSSDGSAKSACMVFDEMIQRGVRLSTLGFGVFIWRVCPKMRFEEVFTRLDRVIMLDSSGINGSVIALLVVHGLCADFKVKDAVCALEELRKRRCKPDFLAYRVVAEALREMRNVAEVEMILKRKRKLGVAPRANDYREFIFQLVSERLTCEAKDLGEIIVNGNFPIEEDVLNVLIGSVSAIDSAQAILFLRFMLEKGKMPSLLTLKNLCENLCKHEKGEELVDVFRFLSIKEYFGNLESYNVMVSYLCKASRVKECYGMLQEMKKKGFEPDVLSYNSLLEACCREDLVRPAKRLWDEMFTSGCDGNLETYNILIQKFSEIGHVEDACCLFYHMFGKGLEPDVRTYTVLLDGLCRAKNLRVALEVFNKSIEQDGTLGNTLLSKFILRLCGEGFLSSASKLLRSFTCDIRYAESHLTLLKCLADVREPVLISEHTKWISDKYPALLHAVQHELSALLSSSSNSDSVIWLLREMANAAKPCEQMIC